MTFSTQTHNREKKVFYVNFKLERLVHVGPSSTSHKYCLSICSNLYFYFLLHFICVFIHRMESRRGKIMIMTITYKYLTRSNAIKVKDEWKKCFCVCVWRESDRKWGINFPNHKISNIKRNCIWLVFFILLCSLVQYFKQIGFVAMFEIYHRI